MILAATAAFSHLGEMHSFDRQIALPKGNLANNDYKKRNLG